MENRGKVCRIGVFRANLGKFGQNVGLLCTSKNCLLLHLCDFIIRFNNSKSDNRDVTDDPFTLSLNTKMFVE